MKSLVKKFVLTAAVLVLSTSMALAAISMESAKSQGLIGEQPDGLLGVVSASPETSAMVETINAERLRRYKEIASKNGTALPQVQALAGKKLIGAASSGEYIKSASGSWQKK